MAKRENYNELYLFMQVVQEGSFTAAAKRLGLAQSGVSRSVRELEERLGVQLLVRTTRKLSLTQAGEQLYQKTASGFEMLDLWACHTGALSRDALRHGAYQCQPARD